VSGKWREKWQAMSARIGGEIGNGIEPQARIGRGNA